MGRHSKQKVRPWAGAGRAAALTGAVGAGMIGLTASPLAGLAAAATPGATTAPAGEAAPTGDEAQLVDGTPCTVTAEACVDLAHNQAWLIQDGHVVRGAVPITHGAPGQETPAGTFTVQRKDQEHRSAEYNNAPMPYSVFFAPGGIAFHEGSLQKQSAGCVHLSHDDAVAWFDALEVGDEVQIR
jgi:hypothetical protein